MKKVKKAIIPCAGFGSRFLPATKAIPKEMLPIIDIPTLQFIVEECVESGIQDICIVLGRNKNAIADHFDRNIEVENALFKAKKFEDIKKMNEIAEKVNICYVRQWEMKGTAKAIEICKSFIGNDPFAVLFGDDLMYNPGNPVTKQLAVAYENTGLAIVGCQQQPPEEAIKYGVIVPGQIKGRYTELRGFKEKPPIDDLPSTLTSLGRFVLPPEILDYIKLTPMAPSGEYYLPTAIELMAKDLGAYAYDFEGIRYDIGDKMGFLKANIEFALRRDDIKNQLKEYLTTLTL